ncbi:MAG: OmpA family protein [Thermodesulfobacteriota bacterium]
MIKRLSFACILFSISCSPAFAIDLPPESQYILENPSTAYTSKTFNSLMMAYGLQSLAPSAVAAVPPSYAKAANDAVILNSDSMAYPPPKYHDILTAYGLQISPEEVAARLGHTNYAKVVDGQVVFGKTSTIYNKSEWNTILKCYTGGAVVAGPGDADGDGVNNDKDQCPKTPLGIEVDERGCWTHAGDFLFDIDSATLKAEAKAGLDGTKTAFAENPKMSVQIEGYTSDTGTEAHNQTLSEKRAQAVMDYLINSTGIDKSRLSAKGFGQSNPAYPNDSDANRAKNRRVEFTPM